MASLSIGFSVTPSGTGCSDGIPDMVRTRTQTLVVGVPAVDVAVSVPTTATAASPTAIWTAAQHGVSAASAAVKDAFVDVDPGLVESSALTIGVRPTYTRASSTTTVSGAVFHQTSRNDPPLRFPGTVTDASGTLYLTNLEALNTNTGTDDAVLARVKGWK